MPPVSMIMCKSCGSTVAPDEGGNCPLCGKSVASPKDAPKADASSQRLVAGLSSFSGETPKRPVAADDRRKDGGAVSDAASLLMPFARPDLSGSSGDRDYDDILEKTRFLLDRNYKIFGLFGWALSGKSSFIFSTGKCSENAMLIEGYRPEGDSWEKLYNYMATSWASRGKSPTVSGHYHYEMNLDRTERDFHVAFMDMSGEDFKNLNKNEMMAEFFLAYAPLCHGFIFMVNLFAAMDITDSVPDDVSSSFFQATIDQLGIISKFISNVADLAAMGPKIKNDWRIARDELAKPRHMRAKGKNRCNMPISICFSQADMWRHRVPDMRLNGFCENGARVPIEHEAWEFMEWLSPGRLRTLMDKAPKLQVAWLSSLGREFNKKWEAPRLPEPDREFKSWLGWRPEKPLGLKSVFDFVVLHPPKMHVKATNTYYLKRIG